LDHIGPKLVCFTLIDTQMQLIVYHGAATQKKTERKKGKLRNQKCMQKKTYTNSHESSEFDCEQRI